MNKSILLTRCRKRAKSVKAKTLEPPSKLEVPTLDSLQRPGRPEDENHAPPFIPAGADTIAYLGFSGDFDPHLMQYYKYDLDSQVAKFFNCAVRQLDSDPAFPVQFLAFPDSRGKIVKDEIAAQRRRLAVLTEGCEDRLLRLFFRLVYPTYPIVDRKKFYVDYMKGSENIDICLYAGILAISVIWNKYDDVLCVKNLPRELYDRLFEECSIAVERSLTRPTLGTVQGLLLIIQKHIIQSDTSTLCSANLHMAKLVSVAHTLGLHIDCESWSISAPEKRLRKRLWATIYIVEKWASANLGTPSLLNFENTTWAAYDEQDPSSLLFIHFGRLTRILDGILIDLYSVREYKERYKDSKTTIAKVDKYFTALQSWRDGLPEDLRDMSYTSSPNEPRKNGILHLAELTIAVLLHRVKMHLSCTRQLPPSQITKYRAQAATIVARIMKYTSEIDNTHLRSFWHSMVRLNFSTLLSFMLLHHISSISKKEFEETKLQVKKFTKMIQGLSKSWAGGTGVASERASTVFLAGDYDASFGHPTPGLVKYGPETEAEFKAAAAREEEEEAEKQKIKLEEEEQAASAVAAAEESSLHVKQEQEEAASRESSSAEPSPEILYFSISKMLQEQENEANDAANSTGTGTSAAPVEHPQPTTLVDPLQFDDELQFATDEPISFLTDHHFGPDPYSSFLETLNSQGTAGQGNSSGEDAGQAQTGEQDDEMERLRAHFMPQHLVSDKHSGGVMSDFDKFWNGH